MHDVDSRWLRCRKRNLTSEHAARLDEAFQDVKDDMEWFDDFTEPMYYSIVDRIAREYNGVWRKHGDDMHLNREEILKSVIPKVLRQICPEVAVPENDNDILEVVQPLIENAFEMPGPASQLKVGSKKWIRKKIDSNEYTFAEMVEYEDLMNHYVAMGIATGDERGYPTYRPEEIIPTGLYLLWLLGCRNYGC